MNSRKFVACWIVLFYAVLCSGCDFFDDDSSAEYLARAEGYFDDQKYEEAILELKNSLRLDSNNANARYLLGKTYLVMHDPASAEKELESAGRLGLPGTELQPYLSKALFAQHKYEEVLSQTPPAGMPDDLYVEWLSVRGESLLALGRPEEAKVTFQEALKIDEGSAAAMIGLARIAALSDDYDDARQWISRAYSSDAKYDPAWALLGDIERQEGNLAESEQAYSTAIGLDPRNGPYLISRSMAWILQGEYDEARADIGKANELVGITPQVSYVSGLLYLQQKQYSEAKEQFEAVLRFKAGDPPATFYLATCELALGNYTQAETGLVRFLNENPDNIPATRLLAVTKLRLDDLVKTEQMASAVLDSDPEDILALRLLASSLASQKKGEQSIKYLRQLVTVDPNSASSHQLLGESLIAQGEQQEGVKQLEKAWKLDPHGDSAAALIKAHIKGGNLDLALETAKAFVADNPAQAGGHVLLGIVYLQIDELLQAEVAFEKALEMQPGSPAAYNGMASIALTSLDYEKARQYYIDALKQNPEHLKLLTNLAEVELLLGKSEASLSALELAVKYHPDSLEPRLTLVRRYLQSGDGNKAIDALNGFGPKYSENPTILAMKADAQMSTGQFEQALTTLGRLGAGSTSKDKVHFLRAKAYYGLGERGKMQKELIKSLELNPSFVVSRIALARALLEDKKVSQAEEQISTLRGQLSATNQDLIMLEAKLRELRGDT